MLLNLICSHMFRLHRFLLLFSWMTLNFQGGAKYDSCPRAPSTLATPLYRLSCWTANRAVLGLNSRHRRHLALDFCSTAPPSQLSYDENTDSRLSVGR